MRRYKCLLLFVVLASPAYVMSEESQWVKAIKNASLVSVEQTLDKGYIAAGYKTYLDGSNKPLLIRFDASANVQWAKTYQLSKDDMASMVLRTRDGGFVFTGSTTANGRDAFLLKVDADGKILWQALYGTPSYEEGRVILPGSHGGFFLLGNSDSGIWCMKLNSTGKILWIKYYGRHTDLSEAVHTSDGGLIFAGVDRGRRIFVKTNSNGNIIWQKKVTSAYSSEVPSSLATTSDGGYVVGGSSHVLGAITVGWVAKLDAAGNVSWSKLIPAVNYYAKRVTAVRQESDGHLLVMGWTKVNNQGVQIWSARFNFQGQVLSQQAFGETTTSFVAVSAVHAAPDDGTVFVGSRDTNLASFGLIGRTSWEGDVCIEFEKSTQVRFTHSDLKTQAAHLGTRNGSFTVVKPRFSQTRVNTKILDLCK